MFRRFLELWRRLLGGGGAAPREGGAGPAADEDRRVWVRYPSSAQTVVQTLGNGIDTRRFAPGIDRAEAAELVTRAHEICPYSRATHSEPSLEAP